MHPRVKIFRKVSCSLMMAIYVLFLCFQVNYNLAVAGKTKLHQQVANEKHAFSGKLIARQNHGAVLAKSKTVPTKRFYPKSVSITPPDWLREKLVHIEHPLGFFHSFSFYAEPVFTAAPMRGPPDQLVC